MFYLCVFSCWRTPETRKTACSVKAGLRAFPEHRETQERSSTVFSLPTIWSVWFTHRKPARIPKRASRPRMESSGLQGTVMLSVKPAQDWTSEETNSITSTASQISINWQLLLRHSHFACFPFASRRTGWNTLPPSPTPTLPHLYCGVPASSSWRFPQGSQREARHHLCNRLRKAKWVDLYT